MIPISARPRRAVVALLVLTVLCGLASRRFPALFPAFVAEYAGDTLWAAMVYWLIVLFRPRMQVPVAAALAFGIALAVEFSQRFHAPWLDAFRSTSLGALLLGQGFLWSDVACYAAGAALAVALDLLLLKRSVGAP
jgi:hypothetical protein